jgi:ABC-type polysaccharide/polyol phosphate export permease
MMIEKINGIRNRLIVAGVKLHQFILAHAIEGCVMLLIHFMTCVAFTLVFFVEVKTFTSLSLIVAIFVMCGLLGIFSAFFIPLVFNDITAATLFNQFILFASMFVSGVFWPIEAFPKICSKPSILFVRLHFPSKLSEALHSRKHQLTIT